MLAVHPLTAERWEDFELLFGPNGATSGCWCMWWRITAAEFAAEAGDGLRAKFKSLVSDEHHPGLLAYWEGVPAGWVSLGDRSEFGRLNRSPKLGPIDDERVASIVCFFVARPFRRKGIRKSLLHSAVDYARGAGFQLVEAYPIDTAGLERKPAELFTGTLDLFLEAGFDEVARRGGRPVVRLEIP